jgi:hypothetical protein
MLSAAISARICCRIADRQRRIERLLAQMLRPSV